MLCDVLNSFFSRENWKILENCKQFPPHHHNYSVRMFYFALMQFLILFQNKEYLKENT